MGSRSSGGSSLSCSFLLRVLSGLLPLLVAAGGTLSAQRGEPCPDPADRSPPSFAAGALAGTRWLFQLQEASPIEIAATTFDTVVMDYSTDGTEAGRYGAGALAVLKAGGARQALAYLSIGEAEDYRYYFQPGWLSRSGGPPGGQAPCWLSRRNPQWKGNYKVQYWSQDWQRIVLGYLDRIIGDGFDGVYLDIVDAYLYWSDPGNGESFSLSEGEAAARMINLVQRIAFQARAVRRKPDFLIVPQNGEGLLDYDQGFGGLEAGGYLKTIDGIGVEDLYYDRTRAQNVEAIALRKQYLDRIKAAGKKVVVLDYVDDGSRPVRAIVGEFLRRARSDGFFPYAARTDRALDCINVFPGQP